jgi:DNA invertase Pin-like site-specific DNA recombinase
MKKLEAQQFVKTLADAGSQRACADALRISQSMVSERLQRAREVLGEAAVAKVLDKARNAVNVTAAQELVETLVQAGTQRAAADVLGLTQSSILERLQKAREVLGDAAVDKALGKARGAGRGEIREIREGREGRDPRTLADAVEAGDTEKVKLRNCVRPTTSRSCRWCWISSTTWLSPSSA